MLIVTKHIRDNVSLLEKVIVAETINGQKMRQSHSGLIYSAYDLHNIPIPKEFIELSLHFAKYNGKDSRDLERNQKAIALCNDVKLELEL